MTTEGDDVLPYVEFFCGRPANIASSFTARCYAERGYATVWRLSVCPSVRPSVMFRYRHHIRTLEYFENSFTAE